MSFKGRTLWGFEEESTVLRYRNTSLNTPWARSNLVDPASSHMLVSKIKPCMSKNNPSKGKSANGSLNQL